MKQINWLGTIKHDDNTIEIDDLTGEKIIINFNRDIDFSPLISNLTQKIDGNNNIALEIKLGEGENNDEKLKLIIETLKDIFNSFNESLKNYEE